MSNPWRTGLDEPGRLASLEVALQASGDCPFELDPASGRLRWLAGRQAQRLFGTAAGQPDSLAAWLVRVHPEDRDGVRDRLLDCQVEGEVPAPPRSRHRLRGATGDYRWIEMAVACVAGSAGLLRVGMLQDVTSLRLAEQRPALSALILETIREAVTVTDRAGTIVWANSAFALLLGAGREPLAGQPLQRFSALSGARRIEQWQEMRDAITRRGAWQGRVDARRLDGVPLVTDACVSVVDGEHGELWVHVHRDVTERLELEEAALSASRAEQQRLGLALHDSLGQELAGTSMLVRTLRSAVSAGAAADPSLLRDVETLLQASVSRCRDLAQGVSPFVIDENGLGAAIQDLVHRVRAASGVAAIRADVCGRTAGCAGNFGHHLYRLAQLALATMLERRALTSIDLQLWCEEDDSVVLAITADGEPMRPGTLGADERLLRHSIARLGGSFEPLQAARQRSGLIVMLPWSAAAPAARAACEGEARTALRA